MRALGTPRSQLRSGVTGTRRMASKSCFLDAQALGTRKPLYSRQLARTALERQRPPRMRGNGSRTAARHPTGSVGSTRRRGNCGTTRAPAGSSVRPALSATARTVPGAMSSPLRHLTVGPFTHCATNRARLSVRSCDHRLASTVERSSASAPSQPMLARSRRPLHGDRNMMGTGSHASMNDAAPSERATSRRCRPVCSLSRSAR